jgi:hypothetical protein
MILRELRERWWRRVVESKLESETTVVKVRGLKPEETIGRPSRADYSLLRGREVMLQAEVRGALGQAFTDEPSDYAGSLLSLYRRQLNTNEDRALLVGAINATYKYLDFATNTKHCRDEGPELCSKKVAITLASRLHPSSKALMIGFQPALAFQLSMVFKNFRVTDKDPDNIGKKKEQVLIEPYTSNAEVIAWSDAVVATGSALVNNTIDEIIELRKGKQLVFYGVTIAAAAYEFNLERLCFESEFT